MDYMPDDSELIKTDMDQRRKGLERIKPELEKDLAKLAMFDDLVDMLDLALTDLDTDLYSKTYETIKPIFVRAVELQQK